MDKPQTYSEAPAEIREAVERLIKTYGSDPALLAGAIVSATCLTIMAAKAEEREGALSEIDTLIESLNEGMMTDAGLTQADRDAMTHQVMALQVAAAAIRKRGEA